MLFLTTIAWRNLWRHRRRSLITAVAMAVGVAMCMASIAINDGMFSKIFEVMVEQQLGHAQVHHPDWPTKHVLQDTVPLSVLAAVEQAPGTVAAAPRLQGFVLLGTEAKSSGAMLVGLDPEREARVGPLAERVVEGRFLGATPAAELAIGVKLAEELDVKLGDSLVAVTQSADGSLGNAVYTITGLVRTGNAQIDRGGAFVHLGDLQDLLVLPDQAHSLTVLSDDAEAVAPYVERLRGLVATDDVQVQAWWEVSPQAAQMMGMRDLSTVIVLGIVFGAAGFGVLNTMMMSVFERTRELGVLKALGMRPGRLVALILVESVLLAGIASSIGLALGGLLDWYLVTVGFDLSSASADGITFSGIVLEPVLRGEFRWQGAATVVAALIVVCLASSIWPAVRAARLDPVESIRAE